MSKPRFNIPAFGEVHATGEIEFGDVASIEAAGGQGGPTPISIVAYNGGKMYPKGYPLPVVVELKSVVRAVGAISILRDHDFKRIVGHAEWKIDGARVLFSGVMSGQQHEVDEVKRMKADGYPWKASLGMIGDLTMVKKGERMVVNGQSQEGPFILMRNARFNEVSILSVAADMDTSASVAAAGITNGVEGMSETQESQASEPVQAAVQASAGVDLAAAVEAAKAEVRRAAAEEAKRVNQVRVLCAGHDTIYSQAIDGGWSVEQTELAVLRAEKEAIEKARPTGVAIHAAGGGLPNREVVTAALLLAHGFSTSDQIAKEFGDKVAEEASSRRNRSYSLKRLMHEVLAAGGKSCPVGAEDNEFIRDVFSVEQRLQASGAPSSLSLTYVLQDVANKAMVAAFTRSNSIVPRCFKVKSAKDFKTLHSVRLEGKGVLEEIGADGEIKHANLVDSEYTIALKTWAKMLGVSRKMMINDDLGAFMDVSRILGDLAYKAHEKLAIETMITPGGSFYTSANSASGGGTALAVDSFMQAKNLFNAQVDSDGYPIDVDPSILLVPKVLEDAADRIVGSEFLISGNTTAAPQRNQAYGKARVLSTPWLSNSKVTSATSTRWFLLADPMELAAFAVAYLNGQRNPTIESSELDFNKLGMQFRIFWDFNFGVESTQGVVKMAGA